MRLRPKCDEQPSAPPAAGGRLLLLVWDRQSSPTQAVLLVEVPNSYVALKVKRRAEEPCPRRGAVTLIWFTAGWKTDRAGRRT